ncbi:MAG: DUF6122 family protein [Gammaproteobacteria bacterium]
MVLHAAIPGGIAWLFFRKYWLKAWLIMLATMLVDLDHLLASPVYDPARCSMGFHPLHQWPAILVYALIVLVRPLRLLGIGLLIHTLLDGLDCLV